MRIGSRNGGDGSCREMSDEASPGGFHLASWGAVGGQSSA